MFTYATIQIQHCTIYTVWLLRHNCNRLGRESEFLKTRVLSPLSGGLLDPVLPFFVARSALILLYQY